VLHPLLDVALLLAVANDLPIDDDASAVRRVLEWIAIVHCQVTVFANFE
jgi:hypothetical protein